MATAPSESPAWIGQRQPPVVGHRAVGERLDHERIGIGGVERIGVEPRHDLPEDLQEQGIVAGGVDRLVERPILLHSDAPFRIGRLQRLQRRR